MAKRKASPKGKKSKATVKKKKKQVQPKAPAPKSLEDFINDADSVLVILETKGRVEVLGVKNTNYAHQAKGLMQAALDSYLVRPINTVLERLMKSNVSMNQSTLQTIRQILGEEDAKTKK